MPAPVQTAKMGMAGAHLILQCSGLRVNYISARFPCAVHENPSVSGVSKTSALDAEVPPASSSPVSLAHPVTVLIPLSWQGSRKNLLSSDAPFKTVMKHTVRQHVLSVHIVSEIAGQPTC